MIVVFDTSGSFCNILILSVRVAVGNAKGCGMPID